jgi:hypothetical protein
MPPRTHVGWSWYTQQTFAPGTYVMNGLLLCLFGVGLAVWALL